jgi:hypothetical protein
VGRGYILTNFWLAEEVNKKVKKKLQHQFLQKPTLYILNKN